MSATPTDPGAAGDGSATPGRRRTLVIVVAILVVVAIVVAVVLATRGGPQAGPGAMSTDGPAFPSDPSATSTEVGGHLGCHVAGVDDQPSLLDDPIPVV